MGSAKNWRWWRQIDSTTPRHYDDRIVCDAAASLASAHHALELFCSAHALVGIYWNGCPDHGLEYVVWNSSVLKTYHSMFISYSCKFKLSKTVSVSGKMKTSSIVITYNVITNYYVRLKILYIKRKVVIVIIRSEFDKILMVEMGGPMGVCINIII